MSEIGKTKKYGKRESQKRNKYYNCKKCKRKFITEVKATSNKRLQIEVN